QSHRGGQRRRGLTDQPDPDRAVGHPQRGDPQPEHPRQVADALHPRGIEPPGDKGQLLLARHPRDQRIRGLAGVTGSGRRGHRRPLSRVVAGSRGPQVRTPTNRPRPEGPPSRYSTSRPAPVNAASYSPRRKSVISWALLKCRIPDPASATRKCTSMCVARPSRALTECDIRVTVRPPSWTVSAPT